MDLHALRTFEGKVVGVMVSVPARVIAHVRLCTCSGRVAGVDGRVPACTIDLGMHIWSADSKRPHTVQTLR